MKRQQTFKSSKREKKKQEGIKETKTKKWKEERRQVQAIFSNPVQPLSEDTILPSQAQKSSWLSRKYALLMGSSSVV